MTNDRMERVRVDAMLQALEQQRNEALTARVQMAAVVAMQKAQLDAQTAEIKNLKDEAAKLREDLVVAMAPDRQKGKAVKPPVAPVIAMNGTDKPAA